MLHIGLRLSATKRLAKKITPAMVAVLSFVLLAFVLISAPLTGTSNLEYLLSQRMSIREWSSTPVPNDVLKTICELSLVSAFDLKGIRLYVMNSSGTYEYDEEERMFILKTPTDSRYELGSDIDQAFIANAPCIVMLAWNSLLEADPLQAFRKAGIVGQNLYVLSIRHNLGGVCIGDSIYANEVSTNIQQHLGLPSNLKPAILFPLGYLREGQSYPTGTPQPTSGNLPTPLQSSIDISELLQNQPQLAVNWKNTTMPQNKLSNILWGAYGYSLLMTGHRTVPSAYGEYPFQIYECNETGVYNYTAENHSLYKTGSVDKRSTIIQHANAPEYVKKAPVLLVFCWNSQFGAHNASDSDSGGRFINVNFGCCLQDLCLSAMLWNCSLSTPFNTVNFNLLRNDLSNLPLTDVYPMFLIGLGERLTELGLHDDAITNALPMKTVVGQGFLVHMNVTAVNRGDFTETFNVTAYANITTIGSQTVTLTSGNSTTVTFTWNTTGFARGSYTISANATVVEGELNTTNNNFSGGPVLVSFVGDVNGDGKVRVDDVLAVASRFGTNYGGPPNSNGFYYDANCDINGDLKIRIDDVLAAAQHFGQGP